MPPLVPGPRNSIVGQLDQLFRLGSIQETGATSKTESFLRIVMMSFGQRSMTTGSLYVAAEEEQGRRRTRWRGQITRKGKTRER